MKKKLIAELPENYWDRPHALSWAKRIAEDQHGRRIKRDLDKPVENLPDKVVANRTQVRRLVAKYRAQLRAEIKAKARGQGVEHEVVTRTLERRIKDDCSTWLEGGERDELLKRPLRRLVPYIERFDWRSYRVVPKAREQEGPTCWAYVATAAFESSLMIQRANFGVNDQVESFFNTDQIILNVKRTLDNVPAGNGGRHEPAFNYYINPGIPEPEIKLNDLKGRDAPIDYAIDEGAERVNAIAWDWVLDKCWRTPLSPAAIQKMKAALIEHGPLAVMIATDTEFNNYGQPDQAAADAAAAKAAAGINLRFPANTVEVKQDKETGKLFLGIGAHVSESGVTWGEDPITQDLSFTFPPDYCPVLERRTNQPPLARPTGCDDAVTYEQGYLGFPANNRVVIETDADTGEVVLQFPTNTNARFTPNPATGELTVTFPADNARVFIASNEGKGVTHFVLLIGWDDRKCAWIIQNTYPQWGYQCNGPNLGSWDPAAEKSYGASEDRGFMYIGYGCNLIGQYAAWIESSLFRRELGRKK